MKTYQKKGTWVWDSLMERVLSDLDEEVTRVTGLSAAHRGDYDLAIVRGPRAMTGFLRLAKVLKSAWRLDSYRDTVEGAARVLIEETKAMHKVVLLISERHNVAMSLVNDIIDHYYYLPEEIQTEGNLTRDISYIVAALKTRMASIRANVAPSGGDVLSFASLQLAAVHANVSTAEFIDEIVWSNLFLDADRVGTSLARISMKNTPQYYEIWKEAASCLQRWMACLLWSHSPETQYLSRSFQEIAGSDHTARIFHLNATVVSDFVAPIITPLVRSREIGRRVIAPRSPTFLLEAWTRIIMREIRWGFVTLCEQGLRKEEYPVMYATEEPLVFVRRAAWTIVLIHLGRLRLNARDTTLQKWNELLYRGTLAAFKPVPISEVAADNFYQDLVCTTKKLCAEDRMRLEGFAKTLYTMKETMAGIALSKRNGEADMDYEIVCKTVATMAALDLKCKHHSCED